MKAIKNYTLAALMLLAGANTAMAQDKIETSASADFVSQYIWRGQDLGNISVQPALGISYKGLSLSAWGSVGLESTDTKEFDLTLSYSIGGFNIGITDYWFNKARDPRYFYYNAHNTSHVFEANIGYDFGPVAIQWFTNFAGNDYKTNDAGETKHAYSSYVEVSAPFKLGGFDWTAAVGAVPYKSSSIYNVTENADVEKFSVVNVSLKATKDINITPTFSVPVFAQIAANPHSQKAYFVFGFTLRP